ncbi:MAG: hypothetical protein K5905_14245 [Roseibium sp.]|uniref:hypothetical protein n=1 Tax=Roseibium sp. TaxID=1936156 RepID=UPI00260ED8F8|nr:hypothetical protein [Roseibium sp.]MCV0426625.1 hypothetical protein [Roseibium sp.]
MSGQSQQIDELLRQRMSVVQELATANAEHHRLLQLTGGADFLALKAGMELNDVDGRKIAICELEANAALVDALHAKLDRIDKKLAEKNSNGERHE